MAHVQMIYLLQMMIFFSYLKSPEDNLQQLGCDSQIPHCATVKKIRIVHPYLGVVIKPFIIGLYSIYALLGFQKFEWTTTIYHILIITHINLARYHASHQICPLAIFRFMVYDTVLSGFIITRTKWTLPYGFSDPPSACNNC